MSISHTHTFIIYNDSVTKGSQTKPYKSQLIFGEPHVNRNRGPLLF